MDPITIGALGASAISTIGGIAGNLFNNSAVDDTNKANKELAIQMYDKQRADSLTDWQKTNDYNSPIQQMQRLREAGLNPNLVYGNGAANTSAMVRSVSADTPKLEPKHYDTHLVDNAIGAYQNIKHLGVQTDNIEAMTALAQKEAMLKMAQTNETIANTEASKYHLGMDKSLQDLTIEHHRLSNRNLEIENQYKLDENSRQALSNTSNLSKTVQEILSMQIGRAKTATEIQHLKSLIPVAQDEHVTKQIENELRKNNIQPHDPIYWRMFSGLLNRFKYSMKTGKLNWFGKPLNYEQK